jgi:hypothetical protein
MGGPPPYGAAPLAGKVVRNKNKKGKKKNNMRFCGDNRQKNTQKNGEY